VQCPENIIIPVSIAVKSAMKSTSHLFKKKCTRDKNKVEKDDDGIEKSELAWSDTLHWKE